MSRRRGTVQGARGRAVRRTGLGLVAGLVAGWLAGLLRAPGK